MRRNRFEALLTFYTFLSCGNIVCFSLFNKSFILISYTSSTSYSLVKKINGSKPQVPHLVNDIIYRVSVSLKSDNTYSVLKKCHSELT